MNLFVWHTSTLRGPTGGAVVVLAESVEQARGLALERAGRFPKNRGIYPEIVVGSREDRINDFKRAISGPPDIYETSHCLFMVENTDDLETVDQKCFVYADEVSYHAERLADYVRDRFIQLLFCRETKRWCVRVSFGNSMRVVRHSWNESPVEALKYCIQRWIHRDEKHSFIFCNERVWWNEDLP